MSHQATIERYADQAGKPDARLLQVNGRSNVFVGSDLVTLYSYGTHFPLARIMPDASGNARGWWLVNGDRYSVSTNRHQSLTRDALNRTGLPVLILPFTSLAQAGIVQSSITPGEILPDEIRTSYAYAATAGDVPESRRHSTFPAPVPAGYDGYYASPLPDGRFTWKVSTHFLGASVFHATYATGDWTRGEDGYDVRTMRNAYFLSAFDDQDTGLYFLAQLPDAAQFTSPARVADALQSLKPLAVVLAESNGQAVTRQGDIFAIETAATTRQVRALSRYDSGVADVPRKRAHLLGTSHTATEVIVTRDGETYARGILRHEPGGWRQPEHARRRMSNGRTWHLIVQNTVPVDSRGQSRSWSRAGNVD
jgi:hypothetical protein